MALANMFCCLLTRRLYSDYIFIGNGFTPEKFAVDVPKAVDMMETCLKVNTTRQCVFSNDTYVNLPVSRDL